VLGQNANRQRDDDVVGSTTVVNLSGHRDDPAFADVVYVGRAMHRGGWRLAASPLACPFRVGRDGTRAEIVGRYRDYLLGRPDLLTLIPDLRGRRIGCWCAPQACHADVIAELADTGAAAARPAHPADRRGSQRRVFECVPYAMECSGRRRPAEACYPGGIPR
jgi:hypothetical protein